MKTLILNGHEILKLGFPQGKVVGMIIGLISDNYTEEQREYVLNFLRGIVKHPEKFRQHKVFGAVALILLGEIRKKGQRAPLANEVYGGRPVTVS